jgi:RNA polymerase sigma-70 factor (ECF subfamily)
MSLSIRPQKESAMALLHHLDAAYNLARWLTRDDHDAEDVVQEAYTRAHYHLSTFRGGDGRAWLLSIVRNCSYDLLRRKRTRNRDDPFDETIHTKSNAYDPEAALLQEERAELVRNAITDMVPRYREILILREIEELSYGEIASIIGIPSGTVMSRLSRARRRLQQNLAAKTDARRTQVREAPSPSSPQGGIQYERV